MPPLITGVIRLFYPFSFTHLSISRMITPYEPGPARGCLLLKGTPPPLAWGQTWSFSEKQNLTSRLFEPCSKTNIPIFGTVE